MLRQIKGGEILPSPWGLGFLLRKNSERFTYAIPASRTYIDGCKYISVRVLFAPHFFQGNGVLGHDVTLLQGFGCFSEAPLQAGENPLYEQGARVKMIPVGGQRFRDRSPATRIYYPPISP